MNVENPEAVRVGGGMNAISAISAISESRRCRECCFEKSRLYVSVAPDILEAHQALISLLSWSRSCTPPDPPPWAAVFVSTCLDVFCGIASGKEFPIVSRGWR